MLRNLHEFIIGLGYVVRGLHLIGQPGLRRYVILPFAINVAIFVAAIYGFVRLLDVVMQRFIPHWLAWLEWLLWVPLAAGLAVAVFYTFSMVANLIAAPFTGLLAERLEYHLRGRPTSPQAGFGDNLSGSVLAIRSQAAALIYNFTRTLPLFVLGFIPGLALVLTPVWMLFSAWMLALGYLATPTGNHHLDFRQNHALASKHRGLTLGLGAGLTVLSLIPLLNFLALPIGTAAATALWVEHLSGGE